MSEPRASRNPRWKKKLGLRLLTCLFSLLGLIFVFIPLATRNYLAVLILGPPAAASFIWSTADSMYICWSSNHCEIHPGARVGVDLIITLGYVATVVLTAVLRWSWTYEEYPTDRADTDRVFAMVTSALVFGGISTLLHLGFLVVACKETHALNKAKREKRKAADIKTEDVENGAAA